MTNDMNVTTEVPVERSYEQLVEDFIDLASQQNKRLDKKAIERGYEDALRGLRGMYGPIFEAATPDVTENIAAILAVPDPIYRFMMVARAAKLGYMHTTAMDDVRRRRRAAISTLYVRYNMGRKEIVDIIGATPRQKRIVDAAMKEIDRRDPPKIPLEEALQEAKTAHGIIAGRVELHRWAVPERDTMIVDLTEGRYADDGTYIDDEAWEAGVRGHKWSNAILARLSKLTTAAVAQYRTGVAGHARQYQRDAA